MGSYQEDLDMLCMVAEALCFIQEMMEKNPVTYPLAIRAYTAILFGTIPIIQLECEKFDVDCEISTPVPHGGLDTALEFVDDAISALHLELALGSTTEEEALADTRGEGPEALPPADYDDFYGGD